MPTGQRNDPYLQFRFLVQLDGIPDAVAGFTEVGGLSTEQDVVEYREGKDQTTMRKLPGLKKFANISLKRGYTKTDALWLWRNTTLKGETERKNGSITLLDEAGVPAMRWKFTDGWVSKYEGPALNSATNEAAIESIEIAHEGLELELAG